MDVQAIIAEKDALIKEQGLLILDLKDQIERMKRMIYGRKSERFIPEPGPNLFSHLEQNNPLPATQQPESKIIPEHKRKVSKHRGRRLLDNCAHLDVEEQTIEVQGSEQLKLIGKSVSEKLGYVPGKLYVKRTIVPAYKNSDTGEITKAELPAHPIPKCEADISLLTHVVTSKFMYHLPEYRIQQMFKAQGVSIPSSTMNNWTHAVADLLRPMHLHLQKTILDTGYIQMDESTIRVMAGKKNRTHLGYMWVMYAPSTRCVCYMYHQSRSKTLPLDVLKNYHGKIQTDGYDVYEAIDKIKPDLKLIHCNAHSRRNYEEAISNDEDRATHVLKQYQKWYSLEEELRQARKKDPQLQDSQKYYQTRLEVRKSLHEKTGELKRWLEKEALQVTPASKIGKAIAYNLKRWEKLIAYQYDGELEIDNNLIENSIRPLALGRKNYLFAGNHNAAKNIGVFYSVFITCKHLEINVAEYLSWYLNKVSTIPVNKINTLSPSNYKKLGT